MAILQIHVPAYNEEEHIESVIEGILGQSFTDFSLVIHDNKSTDRTLEICRRLAARDRRILLDEGSVNVGGLAQMPKMRCGFDAKYVAMRSANDQMHPDYLRHAVGMLEADPSVGLAYSHGSEFAQTVEQAVPSPAEFRIDTRGMSPVDSALEVVRRYTVSFALWGVYRREVYERCRPYQFIYGGDHVFIAEVALYGAVAAMELPLDYRRSNPTDWRKVMASNTKSQLEEHVRQIAENSYFYGLKQRAPFTDMAWGHAEMFSLAGVDDNSKNRLILLSAEILKARFGAFMREEASGMVALLNSVLAGLKDQSIKHSAHILFWLQKARRELEKIRFLNMHPLPEILDLEARISSLLGTLHS